MPYKKSELKVVKEGFEKYRPYIVIGGLVVFITLLILLSQ